jgi:hypothetical protein
VIAASAIRRAKGSSWVTLGPDNPVRVRVRVRVRASSKTPRLQDTWDRGAGLVWGGERILRVKGCVRGADQVRVLLELCIAPAFQTLPPASLVVPAATRVGLVSRESEFEGGHRGRVVVVVADGGEEVVEEGVLVGVHAWDNG